MGALGRAEGDDGDLLGTGSTYLDNQRMAFLISPDLEQFLESLESFFAGKFPGSVVHGEKIEAKSLAADWLALAELGATAAPLPEPVNGLGMGVLAAYTITERAGRWLSPLPVRESIGTVSALIAQVGDVDATAAGELASGAVVGVVPGSAAQSVWSAADLASAKVRSGLRQVELSSLFREKPSDNIIDATMRLGVAAELAGISSRVVEMTVEYVKTRKQFGKPLAAFQAVQHKLSDMLMWSEQISSLGRFAAWAADNDPSQFVRSANAAFGYAAEFAPKLIETSIQMHGGIGFTWEYPLHLYLRRSKSLSALYSGSDQAYINLAAE